LELRDLIVTPLLLMVLYVVAYVVRPYVTDEVNRVYFFPALTVRIIGALAIGFIYQFYYDGGDTFNYHTHGSRQIWEAFMESSKKGYRLFINNPSDMHDVHKYASRILFYKDPSSFAVIRLAFIFDLFTFSSYAATAVLFALVGFVGSWMFFLTFYEEYPHLHRGIAIASFFIPSVFFWGSGLLKDTITLGLLGIAVYNTYRVFIVKRFFLHHIFFLLLALYGISVIKVYILLTFLPAAIVWIFMYNLNRLRSAALKAIIFPFVVVFAIGLGAYAVFKAAEGNAKYAIDKIGETAQVTAYDIRYYTGKNAGSGYSLGDLDGSVGSMIRLAPQAINVALFRPYLWEVRNPLMLLSAMESLTFFVVVLYLMISMKFRFFKTFTNANILFLVIFALMFAFGVGVSTFNFGTLVRYKIPMLPFFVAALTLIYDYSKRLRNVEVFEETE
jgi:hypothetical protein